MNTLVKRILTAIVGIPVAIGVIMYGQWIFAGAIMILAIVGLREYFRMMQLSNCKPLYFVAQLLLVCILGFSYQRQYELLPQMILISVLLILTLAVICHRTLNLPQVGMAILGILYIGLPFAVFLQIRLTVLTSSLGFPVQALEGTLLLWIALIGTWCSDTFAFFVGLRLGKHKLCPALSPGKTIEGAAGGLLGSMAGVLILGSIFSAPELHLLAMGFLVGIAAPLGDLTESMMKRYAGIKDSGEFFPGHGGVLDRFDSLLFAVPVIYYYAKFIL